MSNEMSFVGRVMSVIAAAAALVTVGSVGYCVREGEESRRQSYAEKPAEPDQFEADEAQEERPGRRPEPDPKGSRPLPKGEAELEVPPDAEPDGIDEEEVEPRNPNVAVVNGIRFELVGCHRNAGLINCNLSLTSMGRDIKDVYLTTDSIANASGVEVSAARASFGTIQNHRIHGWGDLAADIPKSGSLRFEGLGVNEPRLALLEIKMVVRSERFSVRFLDVPALVSGYKSNRIN